MSANNTKAHENDIAVECSRVRACKWKGMESDMKVVPHQTWTNVRQRVCPNCGCDIFYRREPK